MKMFHLINKRKIEHLKTSLACWPTFHSKINDILIKVKISKNTFNTTKEQKICWNL